MHLYLHIPFCTAKCPYCDFNSVAGREDEYAAYVDALLTETRRLPRGPYATIFIGGGTPSILPPALLERLLIGLREHLIFTESYEWTCEANPGSADAEKFRILAAHGVNRLSLGVQSTHAKHLTFLGRVHDARQADVALAAARAAVPRVSADLIMGLPEQTLAELRTDLEIYRRHDLAHASVYHLAYEPGTEFYARLSRGELTEINPEASHAYFNALWSGLESLGLELYETSNFAKPGQAARHNLAYWQQRDYHAAGAGAVSTLGNLRVTREKHSGRYIQAISSGGDAVWKSEALSPTDHLAETWMLGLRLAVGVSLADLSARGDHEARWRPTADSLIGIDLLEESDGYLRLTRRGRPVQDEVTIQLLP